MHQWFFDKEKQPFNSLKATVKGAASKNLTQFDNKYYCRAEVVVHPGNITLEEVAKSFESNEIKLLVAGDASFSQSTILVPFSGIRGLAWFTQAQTSSTSLEVINGTDAVSLRMNDGNQFSLSIRRWGVKARNKDVAKQILDAYSADIRMDHLQVQKKGLTC